VRLALDGEVFCWNQKRGIPRVYREILTRVGQIDPEIEVRVGVQGEMRTAILDELGFKVDRIPRLSPTLRPWCLWRHITPGVNSILRRMYWRRCKADVYHTTHYSLPPVAGPAFCIVHDMMPEQFPDSFPGSDRIDLCLRKKKAVERSDLVLCSSQNTRRDVTRLLGVPGDKCRIMHMAGFPGEQVRRVAGPTRKPQKPFFLYVGGYRMPYKNFAFVAECLGDPAFSAFSQFDLVVAGPETPTVEERDRYGDRLRGRLRFLDNCDDDDLIRLYSTCSAFLMPSLYEGFGLPVLEALACGAAVICSDRSSLPEVGGDAVYYFDPESPQEFRDALTEALAEGRCSDAVKRRVQHARRFSWEKTTREFCKTVRDISSAGGSTGCSC